MIFNTSFVFTLIFLKHAHLMYVCYYYAENAF